MVGDDVGRKCRCSMLFDRHSRVTGNVVLAGKHSVTGSQP